MKKIVSLIVVLVMYGQSFSQNRWEMLTIGYQPTGIFDTVGAVILIDNSTLQKVERIRGYAIREWNIWYGGCDPYINPSYKPNPNRWISTGDFLYANKRKIKVTIWNTNILADPFIPIPKTKEELGTKEILLKNVNSSDSLTLKISSLTSIPTDSILLFKPGHVFSMDTMSFIPKEILDTIKTIIYVDEGIQGTSLKIKKYRVYAVYKNSLSNTCKHECVRYYTDSWNELKDWSIIATAPFNWNK